MNRGSRKSWSNVGLGSKTCFNEAPIHESGKCCFVATASASSERFNEAPIHESGKYDHTLGPVFDRIASMRPRFMNRGSIANGLGLGRERGRFNEAPIHESGKSHSTYHAPAKTTPLQ